MILISGNVKSKFESKLINNVNNTTKMGFEPTRAEHIGLAVQHLNHSVTSSANTCN